MRLLSFSSLARQALLLFAIPLLLTASTAPALKQVAVLELPGHPGFDDIALVHGMILVSHPGAGQVDLFDLQKRRIVGHIREMSSPRGVAVDEAAHLVYIANSGARNIVVVSTTDWQVRRIIPVDDAPETLFVVPGANVLYVTFPVAQAVASIDLADNTRPALRLALDGRPYAFAYDPSRHLLFVTMQDRDSIAVLSPTLKPVSRYPLNASEPTSIVFSPHNDRLYVAVRYAILALDPAAGQELSRSAVAGGIDQIVFDEPTASLFGVSDGSVFVVPASASLGPASEFPVDVKGHSLAYDSSTGYIYLPGGHEGRSKLLILRRISGR